MDYLYVTVTLLLVATFLLTAHFRRKSSNFPPTIFPTIPIIGHLYLLKKPLYRTLAKLSTKHGPILFLHFGSRPVLLLSSPSLTEECFTKNDIVFANRPRLLAGKILGCNYTSIGYAPYGDHWRNLRRLSTVEIFSSQRLQEFEDIRNDEARLMIRKLVSECCCSAVNLNMVFHEMTLNVMMRMISGKRFFGGDDMELERGKRFREIAKETFLVGGASNLGDHLPVLRWFGVKGLEKKLVALQKKRDSFIQELIHQLREEVGNYKNDENKNKKRKNTVIEVLLKLQEDGS